MRVIDPGHFYALKMYDVESTGGEAEAESYLNFMKREGPGYPGNVGSYAGTNCQEVIRALIDRVKYADKQIPCLENHDIIKGLRNALRAFEIRAAKRAGRKHNVIQSTLAIEDVPACEHCGHICGGTCK